MAFQIISDTKTTNDELLGVFMIARDKLGSSQTILTPKSLGEFSERYNYFYRCEKVGYISKMRHKIYKSIRSKMGGGVERVKGDYKYHRVL